MTTGTPIDIFAAGQHIAMSGDTLTFSERDLAATAAAYDPTAYEAPLCVGHPQHDAPAYGWVGRLEYRDGHLFALPKQVDPEFAELVRTGRYKKISAAFWHPRSPHNPKPGVWALRHVGFLGAAPPSVKGLKPVQFAGDESGVVLFGADGRDIAFAEREAALAAREAALAERERAMGTQDVAAFVAGLVKEGRLPSGMRDETVEILRNIDNHTVVAFAAPDGVDGATVNKTPLQALKDMLSRLPTMVMFGWAMPEQGPVHEGRGSGVSFAAPPGYQVDTSNADLDRRAREFQAKYGGTYSAAVRAVSAG